MYEVISQVNNEVSTSLSFKQLAKPQFNEETNQLFLYITSDPNKSSTRCI